jgi:hypothetical protein
VSACETDQPQTSNGLLTRLALTCRLLSMTLFFFRELLAGFLLEKKLASSNLDGFAITGKFQGAEHSTGRE